MAVITDKSPDLSALMPAAITVGFLTGLGAWALKILCYYAGALAYGMGSPSRMDVWAAVSVVIGLFLTVIMRKLWFRQEVTDSCKRLLAHFKAKEYRLSANIIWEAIVGCALTVGGGASAGIASPMAYAGGAIGSNVGRMLKHDDDDLRVLIACGAGAGIAGIFSAPIGGMFFVFEVLRLELSTVPVLCIGASCLMPSIINFIMADFRSVPLFVPPELPDMSSYPALIILGMLIGVYCVWYTWSMHRSSALIKKIKNRWVQASVSALILGGIVLILPGLFSEGYRIVRMLMAGEPHLILEYGLWARGGEGAWLLAAIFMLLIKGLLVGIAINGGGVAGDFAPTLFTGAIFGWLFATAANYIGAHLDPSTFIFLGMAGAMAGILHAPLMSIFIVLDTSMHYELLPPVAFIAIISYLISHWLRGLPGGYFPFLKSVQK